MKKKIIAVLLTGAMLLGNAGMVSAAAPEAGLEMPEMTEEFSDFGDSAEVFDDGGMEEFDEIAAEEEPFADQPVFEDEKELPVVEDAQIQIAGAGEGVTAPTSVWREGASFGRQKELVKLKGAGTSTQSYWGNWASPETTGFYRDDAGEMHIVTFDGESGKLIEGTCRNSEIVSLKEIKLPLPKWGGFYAAPDGYFYVAVGQDNLEESNTKIVVKILKYDRSWKLLGCADVPGGTANAFPGIYIPFDAASLRMTLIGNTLVVHTGREMFGMEGVHHQSNITFVVDTENMQLINSDIPYTSHSFNQFVVNDGNGVYYLDHGDAFDRGLILSRFSAYGNGYFTGGASFNIFPFMGTIGNNYTGCEVTGFALEGETLMILGKSVPHNFPVSGVTGDDYELNQNVFLILTDKNTGNTTFQWLTDYAPNGKRVKITEPKLVKTAPDRYAVLYSEEASGKSILYYRLITSGGTILLKKTYEGVTIQTNSQPFLMDQTIYWTSGKYENGDYDNSETYLYKLPVVTVPITGIAMNKTKLSIQEGKKEQLAVSFAPENTDDVKDVIWKSSNTVVASVNSKGLLTAKSYGSTTITAVCGPYSASCKVSVSTPANNEKLKRPTLKSSQNRADKIHLSWNQIKGVKGYLIYSSSSAKGSYKRVANVKSALACDIAATPGKTYYYKMRAYGTNAKGGTKYSDYSSVISRKAAVPKPSNVSASNEEKGVAVSWGKVTGASGYVVYRDGKAIKTLNSSQLKYLDTKVRFEEGKYTRYDYHVKAFRTVNGKRIYSGSSNKVYVWNWG